jgi:hypothetical protein
MLGIFAGHAIGPHGFNFSYLDDRQVNRKLKAAARLPGARRNREYNRLALEIQRDLFRRPRSQRPRAATSSRRGSVARCFSPSSA